MQFYELHIKNNIRMALSLEIHLVFSSRIVLHSMISFAISFKHIIHNIIDCIILDRLCSMSLLGNDAILLQYSRG